MLAGPACFKYRHKQMMTFNFKGKPRRQMRQANQLNSHPLGLA